MDNDVSESVIVQIVQQMGKEKGNEYLKEMRRDPHQESIERACSIFGSLTKNQAAEILKKYGYSIEDAFEELEQVNLLAEEEENRRRQELERKKKEQENQQYIETFMRHFKNLSKEEITRVFNESDKDPKRTSQALCELIRHKERENEESQRLRKQQEQQNLCRLYSGIYTELEEGYILKVIQENDADPEKITNKLDVDNKQKLFEKLFLQFSDKLTSQEIQGFMRQANWKRTEASRMCLEKVRLVEELKEKQRREEERRERERQEQERLEREQREREEREKLLHELKEQQKREEELLRLQQEQEKRLQEKREREQREQEERERLRLEQEQREKEQREKEIPVLELNEKDLQDIQHQSAIFTIPFIKENITREEQIQQEQQEQIIERIIAVIEPEEGASSTTENSMEILDKPIEIHEENLENQELNHSITVTEQEGKLHAQAKVLGSTSYTWIGFYKKGEADSNYLSYNYLCKLKDNTLVVDRPSLNGEYEFRAFLYKYQISCKSDTVKIENESMIELLLDENASTVIKVSWKVGAFDPYQSRAYATIHKVEEKRYNYYRRWCWMEKVEGSYSFKKPIHSGVYEARVYIGSELKYTSNQIEIQGI